MGEVAVEPKWDGVRVQIHYIASTRQRVNASVIKTFSRNLENTTEMFPELQMIGDQLDVRKLSWTAKP